MPLKQSRGLDGPFIFTSASFAVYARIHAAGNTIGSTLLRPSAVNSPAQ